MYIVGDVLKSFSNQLLIHKNHKFKLQKLQI